MGLLNYLEPAKEAEIEGQVIAITALGAKVLTGRRTIIAKQIAGDSVQVGSIVSLRSQKNGMMITGTRKTGGAEQITVVVNG